MANPRIDELKKRLDKDPGSRLFAQLAEELRKDGELQEAIRVCRSGLQKHPAYPSARMTLGRALLDTGDYGSARAEFDSVVKAAPDNILASRYLAESLEALGDGAGAIARYRLTLSMAPGDKQIQARLQALEEGAQATVPVPSSGSGAPPPGLPPARPATSVAHTAAPAPFDLPSVELPGLDWPAEPAASVEPPPIKLVDADEEFELESAHESRGVRPQLPTGEAAAAGPGDDAPPIPLVAVDEEFELERPYEARATVIGGTPQVATPVGGVRIPLATVEEEFELERPREQEPPPGRPSTPAPSVSRPPVSGPVTADEDYLGAVDVDPAFDGPPTVEMAVSLEDEAYVVGDDVQPPPAAEADVEASAPVEQESEASDWNAAVASLDEEGTGGGPPGLPPATQPDIEPESSSRGTTTTGEVQPTVEPEPEEWEPPAEAPEGIPTAAQLSAAPVTAAGATDYVPAVEADEGHGLDDAVLFDSGELQQPDEPALIPPGLALEQPLLASAGDGAPAADQGASPADHSPATPGGAGRRLAVEQTIGRLEGFLAAVKRGPR